MNENNLKIENITKDISENDEIYIEITNCSANVNGTFEMC